MTFNDQLNAAGDAYLATGAESINWPAMRAAIRAAAQVEPFVWTDEQVAAAASAFFINMKKPRLERARLALEAAARTAPVPLNGSLES